MPREQLEVALNALLDAAADYYQNDGKMGAIADARSAILALIVPHTAPLPATPWQQDAEMDRLWSALHDGSPTGNTLDKRVRAVVDRAVILSRVDTAATPWMGRARAVALLESPPSSPCYRGR